MEPDRHDPVEASSPHRIAEDDAVARLIGWTLVAIQLTLFAALALVDRDTDWSVPHTVDVIGWGMIALGAIIVAAAISDLGSALTATPEPKADERLREHGCYAHVRHPVYSGVLSAVVGRALHGGSWTLIGLAVLTTGFFAAKARWEEHRLAAHHPGYLSYSTPLPRFVPDPRGIVRRRSRAERSDPPRKI